MIVAFFLLGAAVANGAAAALNPFRPVRILYGISALLFLGAALMSAGGS